jgi:hypothetical protein
MPAKNVAPHLEKMKATLADFFIVIEDMAIESDVCRELINALMISTPEDLDATIAQAKASPERRSQARQQFAGMWESISDAMLNADYEDTLLRHSEHGKPH